MARKKKCDYVFGIGKPIGVCLVDENGIKYGKKSGDKIVPFEVDGFVVTDKELLKLFKMETKKSHCRQIAGHLINGHSINPMAALRLYGCMRLSARIHDLRNGKNYAIPLRIKTTIVKHKGKHFAEYSIKK